MKIFLMILLCLSLLLVTGCGGPDSTAKDYVSAILNGDKAKIHKLTVPMKPYESAFIGGVAALGISLTRDRNFLYITTKHGNSQATVQVQDSQKRHLMYIELENISDEWKVKFIR